MSANYTDPGNAAALRHAASELRRMAPNAPAPPDGDSHDGRRAFQAAADVLDNVVEAREDRKIHEAGRLAHEAEYGVK